MHQSAIIDGVRDVNMAADAMIKEGSALRQPSVLHADQRLARTERSHRVRHNPWSSFFAGFAAGLVISLFGAERTVHSAVS